MPKKSHTSVGMSDQPQDDLENLKTQLATAVSQGTSREGLVSALQHVLEQLQQAVQTGVPAAEQQMLEHKFDDEQTPGSAAADTQRQLAGAGCQIMSEDMSRTTCSWLVSCRDVYRQLTDKLECAAKQ